MTPKTATQMIEAIIASLLQADRQAVENDRLKAELAELRNEALEPADTPIEPGAQRVTVKGREYVVEDLPTGTVITTTVMQRHPTNGTSAYRKTVHPDGEIGRQVLAAVRRAIHQTDAEGGIFSVVTDPTTTQ